MQPVFHKNARNMPNVWNVPNAKINMPSLQKHQICTFWQEVCHYGQGWKKAVKLNLCQPVAFINFSRFNPNSFSVLSDSEFSPPLSVSVWAGCCLSTRGSWSLDKFAPVTLLVRLADSAPAGTRDALLREENAMSLPMLHPAAGGGVDRVAGHITTPTGISAAITVSSCRGLLGQLGGAAPAPAPAPAPADTETVSQRSR